MANSNEKPARTSFFKGLKVEFKKISWPDKESIAKQSAVVVVIAVILGFIIAILDFIIKYGVSILTSI